MKYGRILLSVANTPWAMEPTKLAAFVDFLRLQASGEKFSADEIEARIDRRTENRVAETRGDVAVIPLHGAIMPRASMLDEVSGLTSAQGFMQNVRKAIANPAVKALVIDIDSPGGSVGLIPEAAAELRSLRGGSKPIVAVANTLAASAAYWIGASVDELVVSPSADVGSIGVFSLHEDVSRMMDEAGVTATFIKAGKFKTEGNSFEPLSDDGRRLIQARVDQAYDEFVAAVAAGRNVSADAVRSGFGQGFIVGAEDAVAEGMADRVGTMEETLERFGVRMRVDNSQQMSRRKAAARELDLLTL